MTKHLQDSKQTTVLFGAVSQKFSLCSVNPGLYGLPNAAPILSYGLNAEPSYPFKPLVIKSSEPETSQFCFQ